MSSSLLLQLILFILLGWFLGWEVSGRTPVVSWGVCFQNLFKIARSVLGSYTRMLRAILNKSSSHTWIAISHLLKAMSTYA